MIEQIVMFSLTELSDGTALEKDKLKMITMKRARKKTAEEYALLLTAIILSQT